MSQPTSPPPPKHLTLTLVSLFYGAMLLLAAGWAALLRPGLGLLLATPLDLALPWWLAGLLIGIGLVLLTILVESRSEALRRVGTELAQAVAPINWRRALVLALWSGLSEEALFRGPLQYVLTSAFGVFGYALTALVFALLHGGIRSRYLPWSTFALLAGLLFGLLAAVYASPWPAALAHIVVNAVNLRRLARYVRDEAAG